MSTPSISPLAQGVIDHIKSCKGQFIRVRFTSNVKGSASSKLKALSKITEGIFRSGIDYANLKKVKDGIESGERGEVESLPWGEWLLPPWIIGHKDTEYLRLYPVDGQKMDVTYIVDGQTVDKATFQSYLTPSQCAEREAPACITKKLNEISILGCWENPDEKEADCCE